MQNKQTSIVSFTKQTPEMLIGRKESDLLYAKAFLSREEKAKSEFCQNTTTWD